MLGKTLTFEVEPSDTVQKLKEMIADREGFDTNLPSFSLIYGGKDLVRSLKSLELSGMLTLSELNIKNESILY